MIKRLTLLVLSAVLLSGCTSLFGGGSAPKMAYIGDLSNNRVARVGEIMAYAKGNSSAQTYVYIFKGVDGSGGIHIMRTLRSVADRQKAQGTSLTNVFSSNQQVGSQELVFMPDQTLLVSPGVHIVFIRSQPNELHYRVVMPAG
jgi:hypothetical protein